MSVLASRGTPRAIVQMLLAAISLFAASPAMAVTNCGSVAAGSRFGDSVVILSQAIPAGDYAASDGVKLTNLPAFCRMFAVASSGADSRILIEVWLPERSAWNGKLLGIGNGGHAGKIDPTFLANGLRRGYVTASTDMGSAPAAAPGIEFNFGNGRPQAIRDFGYRATHAMTVFAKLALTRLYGKAPERSYFVGCSTGGNQALSEAQRFPDDYDGIVAGAPAHNRTHLHVHFMALRQLGSQPGAAMSMPLMAAWQKAIIKSCAGHDGGAPSDRFLTNPLLCRVSPRQLACKASGRGNEMCLSDGQVKALERIYAGMRNPRTNESYYFPDVRGAEELIYPIYDRALLGSSAFDLSRWILPADRDASTFDFDHDLAALDSSYATVVNAMDPDLTAFANRGGKLILYHGWADGIISPLGTIDYYQRMHAQTMARESFAKLFLVPGMGHCATGPGATNIGQLIAPRANASAQNDILEALDHWVTAGKAPAELLAGKSDLEFSFPAFRIEGRAPESRPVCAFPFFARYDGVGDPLSAASFHCSKGDYPPFPTPGAQYLR